MNYQLSTSRVENATTQRDGQHLTHCNQLASNCSTDCEISSQSDWQKFMQLLSNSDSEGDIEQIETTQLSPQHSPFSIEQQEDRDEFSSESGIHSIVTDYTGIGLSSFCKAAIVEHVSNSASATLNSMPGAAAAARLVEEMQTRSRRTEARRWQISLPGMPGGSVLVSMEIQDDDSWVVELCIPDECSAENRMALQRKLTESLEEINLSTSSL